MYFYSVCSAGYRSSAGNGPCRIFLPRPADRKLADDNLCQAFHAVLRFDNRRYRFCFGKCRKDSFKEVRNNSRSLGASRIHLHSGLFRYRDIHSRNLRGRVYYPSPGRRSSSFSYYPGRRVSAQPLPFIDMLFIRPRTVSIEDFSIRIPSPEAFVLHKLIIAQRRTGRDKIARKEKDLQQCSALVEIILSEEVLHIVSEYRLSKVAKNAIRLSCSEAGITLPDWEPRASRLPG